ncbi:hypothetical protein ALC56_04092 [Trachymyrmex septentrionalis]|uniref:Peptidase A2 domain-containing protein n=1 Tax=Trachymyrmex septentrionalis TaxID=34720 RepID=A0A151JYN4_9HYME|nr:hypothetical protein ALC56_04092 [Trachymyrmex septentrionalis]
MLDTGSGPNIIKEKFISRDTTVNHNNILKLNGINEYPVYTLGEINLPLFENKVTFHIVANDFPITQSGILGNDFFKQTSSKNRLLERISRHIRNYYIFLFSRNHYSISANRIIVLS